MKICTFCKQKKSISEFARANDKKSGHASRCKSCKLALYHSGYSRYPLHRNKPKPPDKRPAFKNHAKNLFQSAVRYGKIKRESCEVCGEMAQGHHEDYSKPYDVIWLCYKHHMERHRKPVHLASLIAVKKFLSLDPDRLTGERLK